MEFSEYIKPELMVLVPVLYFIGAGMTKNGLPDRWFPLVLGIVGMALAGLYIVATCECNTTAAWMLATFATITQGVLVAGASVYAHELLERRKPPDDQRPSE